MRLGEWINRKRHNRGFGIQSPSAFFFVTEVLREQLPYYAYKKLDSTVEKYGGMSKKHARELFRITNYIQPDNCISIASPAAAEAMKAARPTATHYILEGRKIEEYNECMKECRSIGMLYLSDCPCKEEIISTAISHTNNKSIIIVAGIHKDKATALWWQRLVDNPTTIVTYDMYSYGLLFFDKEKKKQHYKLKR